MGCKLVTCFSFLVINELNIDPDYFGGVHIIEISNYSSVPNKSAAHLLIFKKNPSNMSLLGATLLLHSVIFSYQHDYLEQDFYSIHFFFLIKF